jgi:hypothetical protein
VAKQNWIAANCADTGGGGEGQKPAERLHYVILLGVCGCEC